MPQVYNKDLARSMDGSAFSKNSRFMNVNQTSSETAKRLQARLKVEKRFREHHLAIAERYNKTQQAHLDRLTIELNESLLRKKAYQRVIAKKSFSKIPDKETRLNSNYSMYALRFDIAEQLRILDPAYIREAEAMKKVEKAKNSRDKLIHRNLRTILSPRARIRKELRKQLNLDSEDTMFSTVSSVKRTPTLSRQRTKGLVVTKNFVKDRKAGDIEEISKTRKSEIKLPPIEKTPSPSKGGNTLTVPEIKPSSPLPSIKTSDKQKSKDMTKKTFVFNSQKPSLPAIKIN